MTGFEWLTEGALVWWIRCSRAGYSMPVRVPAVVARINRTTVSLWAATVVPSHWAKRVAVKLENLRPRDAAESWKGCS